MGRMIHKPEEIVAKLWQAHRFQSSRSPAISFIAISNGCGSRDDFRAIRMSLHSFGGRGVR